MTRHDDQQFAVSKSWFAIREFRKIGESDGKPSDEPCREGVVATTEGFVWVYSEEGLSNYQIIVAGRHHTRSEDRSRDNDDLARSARKFVKDVTTGKKRAKS